MIAITAVVITVFLLSVSGRFLDYWENRKNLKRSKMMKFIIYNTGIFKFWFKYILLKTPIKIEAIEFLQKNYNATKREKKLIDKVKKINKMKLEEKNYTEQENNTYKVYAKHFAIVNFPYLTQEEFINKIKTDDDFAKKWGQIE